MRLKPKAHANKWFDSNDGLLVSGVWSLTQLFPIRPALPHLVGDSKVHVFDSAA